MGNLMGEEVVRDMTPKLIKDLGTRYPTEKSTKKARYGLYECAYCGSEFETIAYKIKSGHTRSCGCLRGDAHGLTSNIFYHTWSNMCRRCNNPTNGKFKHYGARGIKVCDEWLDIKNFIAWAELTHPNIRGVTLDRIDNDKGYSPENCRWADATTQMINQRMKKNNTSGYIGVSWRKDINKWTVRLRTEIRYECLGHFDDLMGAVIFRDNYIIENKLPHKLNLKQEKINE